MKSSSHAGVPGPPLRWMTMTQQPSSPTAIHSAAACRSLRTCVRTYIDPPDMLAALTPRHPPPSPASPSRTPCAPPASCRDLVTQTKAHHHLRALLRQENISKLRLGRPRRRGISRRGSAAGGVVVRRTVKLHRHVVLWEVDVHREIPVSRHALHFVSNAELAND